MNLQFALPDSHPSYKGKPEYKPWLKISEKELTPDVSAQSQILKEDILIASIKGMHEERLNYEFQANTVGDGMERLRNLVKIKKLDRVIQDMYQLLL